jgi:transcription antitermination factor NusG
MSTACQTIEPSIAVTLCPSVAPETPRWYAVYTRARHEKRIDGSLRQVGVESFLPLVNEIHRWSDRRKEVDVPLFPGYLFVHIVPDPSMRWSVLKTPGVLGFVGKNDENSAIPDDEIQNVRMIVARKTPFFASPFIKVGRRVRIRGGALDGVEGILGSHKGNATVVVCVELIQRSVSVSIEGYDIEAA